MEYKARGADGERTRLLQRRDHAVPAHDLVMAFDLGQENAGDARNADDRVEIGFGEAGFQAVDPHPDALVGDLRRIGFDAGARVLLFRGRHRVLEVEDEGVRWQGQRLVEKLLAIGRDIEKAAGQGHWRKPVSLGYSAAVIFAFAVVASLVTPLATSSWIAAGT